jgi:hypothetical protein
MPLIDIDESWEEYDSEEERRREEMFPVFDVPSVNAQVTSWDSTVSKKGNPMIEWTCTIVEDTQYAGKELIVRTPTTGKGKYILKNFLDACRVRRAGKGVDPEQCMGKVVTLSLSVHVSDEGRKSTQIDAVSAA